MSVTINSEFAYSPLSPVDPGGEGTLILPNNPYGMTEIYSDNELFQYNKTQWATASMDIDLFDKLYVPEAYNVNGAVLYLECNLFLSTDSTLNGSWVFILNDERQETIPWTVNSASSQLTGQMHIKLGLWMAIEGNLKNTQHLCLNFYTRGSTYPITAVRAYRAEGYVLSTGRLNLRILRRNNSTSGAVQMITRNNVFFGGKLP